MRVLTFKPFNFVPPTESWPKAEIIVA